MKKIKELISKYDTYILFAFFIICSLGPAFFTNLEVSDEMWNFQNLRKLYNGYQIYSDANIIITPLFYIIGLVIFYLVDATLLTFRLYNVLIISTLGLVIYNMFKNLKLSKASSLISSLIIYSVTMLLATAGANYNALVAILYILGVTLSIKESKFDIKIYNLLQGIIIFLIFFTKQNVAIYYIFGILLSELLVCKRKYKEYIKSVLYKFSIAFIFILFSIFILYLNGSLYDFINYTMLGIPEFANSLYIEIYSIKNLGFVITIFIIALMFINNKNSSIKITKDINENIIKLLSFGIFMLLVSYPIFNLYHTLIGSYIMYVLALYLVNILFHNNNTFKQIIKYLVIIIMFILLTVSLYYFVTFINLVKKDNINEINIYKNIITRKKTKEDILLITNYIINKEKEGKKVVLFSKDAALYMTALNKSNGAMDLPFIGNMGINGQANMLEKIKKLSNSEILILKDPKDMNLQESHKIRDYIIKNYIYIGEISKFYIYSK